MPVKTLEQKLAAIDAKIERVRKDLDDLYEKKKKLQNPITFVYRLGLLDAQYGPATAVGLFKSVISTIFISASYFLGYKFADYRIF